MLAIPWETAGSGNITMALKLWYNSMLALEEHEQRFCSRTPEEAPSSLPRQFAPAREVLDSASSASGSQPAGDWQSLPQNYVHSADDYQNPSAFQTDPDHESGEGASSTGVFNSYCSVSGGIDVAPDYQPPWNPEVSPVYQDTGGAGPACETYSQPDPLPVITASSAPYEGQAYDFSDMINWNECSLGEGEDLYSAD